MLMEGESQTVTMNQVSKQITLWIGSNGGGMGKTTLSIHLGYEMARRGFTVALLDLDSNGSMAIFCGFRKKFKPSETMAAVFDQEFNGDWPLLTPEWEGLEGRFQFCPGGRIMSKIVEITSTRRRRDYILADQLRKYPLPHDLIILDCPAQLGALNDMALAASTHMLVPHHISYKSGPGTSELLDWYRGTVRDLELDPPPKILGFVGSHFKEAEAAQKKGKEQMPAMLNKIKIHSYRPIRYSSEFNNASGRGLPLFLYRPNHEACSDFLPICDDLNTLLRK